MIDPHQSEKDANERHRCSECREWHVIPSLARDCEARHAEWHAAMRIGEEA